LATMVAVSCGRHFTTSAVRMGQWSTAKLSTIVDTHVAAVRRTWTTGEAPPSARGYRWASLARRVPLKATKRPNRFRPWRPTFWQVPSRGWEGGRAGLGEGRGFGECAPAGFLGVLKKIAWHAGCLETWRGKFSGARVGQNFPCQVSSHSDYNATLCDVHCSPEGSSQVGVRGVPTIHVVTMFVVGSSGLQGKRPDSPDS